MIQWYLVFFLFAAEAIFCLGLLLPLPACARLWCLSKLWNLWDNSKCRSVVCTLFALVLLLFIDAVRESNRLSDELHNHRHQSVSGLGSHHGDSGLLARMFRAQRNAYLTGFCLFLWILIFRLAKLLVPIPVTSVPFSSNTTSSSITPTTVLSSSTSSDATNHSASKKTQ